MSLRADAQLLAVLKRVRHREDMLAFSQEWWRLGDLLAPFVLDFLLLCAGAGFVCSICGDAFCGVPDNFKTKDKGEIRPVCLACAREAIAEWKRGAR